MSNLWFSEDNDGVYGNKSCFKDIEEFKKEANGVSVEQTGFGCIVGKVECEVFLTLSKTLEGERIYKLKDIDAEIETLYYAECENLENYFNEEDTEEILDVISCGQEVFVNKVGERFKKCDRCEMFITAEEYKKNDGICDLCKEDAENTIKEIAKENEITDCDCFLTEEMEELANE